MEIKKTSSLKILLIAILIIYIQLSWINNVFAQSEDIYISSLNKTIKSDKIIEINLGEDISVSGGVSQNQGEKIEIINKNKNLNFFNYLLGISPEISYKFAYAIIIIIYFLLLFYYLIFKIAKSKRLSILISIIITLILINLKLNIYIATQILNILTSNISNGILVFLLILTLIIILYKNIKHKSINLI